ncbi:DUF2513 domain-containing protein [Oceanobacillus oncorhynchi subsp. oncorhynchi]|uniref:DUF2513 domain-containing protein n=1 Tax=Oceanobacillus oncorhynchi TaxID=545501 RepID=UPI0031E0ADF7
MERDNKMIRDLLIQFRNEVSPNDNSVNPNSEKEDYHIYLLMNSKFIEAERRRDMGKVLHYYDDLKITSAGHDFLDAAENETVWNKSKDFLKRKGEDIAKVPLNVLSGVLTAQLKSHLGIE